MQLKMASFPSGPALSLTTGVMLRVLQAPKKIFNSYADVHMPVRFMAPPSPVQQALISACLDTQAHLYSIKLIFNRIFVLRTIMPSLVPGCKLPFQFHRPTWQNRFCRFMKQHLHSVFHTVWHASTGMRSTELQFIAP